MIEEIVEVVFDVVLEFVPTVVWKALLLFGGVAATVVGVMLLNESPGVGAGLTLVGLALVVGTVASLYR